jgi:hypothetical protein
MDWRRLQLAVTTAAVIVLAAVPWAVADGGAEQWTATYGTGAPAFTADVVTSPDGETVFVTGSTFLSSKGHYATVAYEASTGRQRWAEEFPSSDSTDWGRAYTMAISPDGARVFVSGFACKGKCDGSSAATDGTITVAYDARTGQRLWVTRFASKGGGPVDMAVSPAGTRVFVQSVTDLGNVRSTIAYDALTGEQLWTYSRDTGGYAAAPGALTLSPDGTRVYVGSTATDGTETCADTGGYLTVALSALTGGVLWTATYAWTGTNECGTATDIGLAPDGSTVFVTGYGNSDPFALRPRVAATVAYDAITGTQKWVAVHDDVNVFSGVDVSLGVAPEGSTVFVAGNRCDDWECLSSPGTVIALDTTSGGRRWTSTFQGADSSFFATDLAVNPDGSAVYVTGIETLPCLDGCEASEQDAPVLAYDAATGAERWVSIRPNNGGYALTVSPDGGSVYLAGTVTGAQTSVRARGPKACSTCGYSTARLGSRPGPGTFQDGSTSMVLDGWEGRFDRRAVGGAYRQASRRGATATFRTPRSTSIAWLTQAGPDRGRARLVVDGRSRGVIDLYAPSRVPRTVSVEGLSARRHRIGIKVLGRKAPAATGRSVVVDGFSYDAQTGTDQESSPRVRYGSWRGAVSASASAGTARTARTAGSRLTFGFKGRSATWLTRIGPTAGKALVKIDHRVWVVDLYRPKQQWRAAMRFDGLAKGRHRMTITVIGQRNHASHAGIVIVDAIVVRG